VPWDLRRNSNSPARIFGNVTRDEGEKQGSVVRRGTVCHEITEKIYSRRQNVCLFAASASADPWDTPSHVLEINGGVGGRRNGAILETGYLSPHLRPKPPYRSMLNSRHHRQSALSHGSECSGGSMAAASPLGEVFIVH
jgi:hypothetical protein